MSNFHKRFVELKNELKVLKNIKNTYGGFMYRNLETIQENLKPLEKKHNILIQVNSNIVVIQDKLFHEATAFVIDVENGQEYLHTRAYAQYQPNDSKVKMNESQLSGSALSYASKYALGLLLGLDDNKDADDETQAPKAYTVPTTKSKSNVVEVKEESKEEMDLYAIKEKSINANTPDEINDLLDQVAKLGGDEPTERVLSVKARQLGYVMSAVSKKYVKREE